MENIENFKNKIICGECSQVMTTFPDECIDLVVCSPPYDSLREYQNYVFDYKPIIKELYRVMKQGGVVVWVIGDEVTKGSETGSSFKQALYFKEMGFNIHDTMIYEKNGSSFPARKNGKRYSQIFEYMFIFSKGVPKNVNLIIDKKNRWAKWVNWGTKSDRTKSGELVQSSDIKEIPEFSPRNNIWKYNTGAGFSSSDKLAKNHPAIFPENLVKDHIISWSNENDIVLDIFNGSGTTCKVAKSLKRNYIGIEISQEYCDLAEKRVNLEIKDKKEYFLLNNEEIIKPKDEIKEIKMIIDKKEFIYKLPESELEGLMYAIKEWHRIEPSEKIREKAKKSQFAEKLEKNPELAKRCEEVCNKLREEAREEVKACERSEQLMDKDFENKIG